MIQKISQWVCGRLFHHDLIRDEGAYKCVLCLKKVYFYSYDLKPSPAEIERSNRETYEFLLDHEMGLGAGG